MDITRQIYELIQNEANASVDWTDVLEVHKEAAAGFGYALGRAYAACPSLEAKLNVGFAIAMVDEAAQRGYEDAQTEVAAWRLDGIARAAGKPWEAQDGH